MIALRDHGLFPSKPEPVQILNGGGYIVEFEAIGINVVIAKEKLASGPPSTFGRGPKGAGMTEMEVPGGGGSETSDVIVCWVNHV